MTTEPAWLTAAQAKLGVRETPGPANNPVLMGWAKRLGIKVLGIAYGNDSDTPWCGLFVTECLSEAGVDLSAMKIGVRASSWATWGYGLSSRSLAPGAILVFQRPGGGHVGFYVGEDDEAFHVLGGNQHDCVSITRIAKERCIAMRWPSGQPKLGGPILMAAAGGVSEREA